MEVGLHIDIIDMFPCANVVIFQLRRRSLQHAAPSPSAARSRAKTHSARRANSVILSKMSKIFLFRDIPCSVRRQGKCSGYRSGIPPTLVRRVENVRKQLPRGQRKSVMRGHRSKAVIPREPCVVSRRNFSSALLSIPNVAGGPLVLPHLATRHLSGDGSGASAVRHIGDRRNGCERLTGSGL